MMKRRTFLLFGWSALALLPVLGCNNSNETNVQWFLSDQEIMRVGKSYHEKSFRALDNDTLVVNGWIITTVEAEVCKETYLSRA